MENAHPGGGVSGSLPVPAIRSGESEEISERGTDPIMTVLEVGDRQYRIEVWTDLRWDLLPEDARPLASRAHTNDGWFLMTRIPE